MARIFAFIDSQNLNLSVKNTIRDKNKRVIYHGWNLDFHRFRVYLQDKYNVQKAFLFIGKIPGNEKLYSDLSKAGYTIIFKPAIPFSDGNNHHTKGNVDAELVLHTMLELQNYDKSIIVSGDGDFHCLIKYLVEQDKLLKLMIPNKYNYSSLLRKYRKYMVFVSDLKGKLERK